MAKLSQLKTPHIIIGFATLAFAANHFGMLYWNHPFLYCWLSPYAASLYLAWGPIFLFVLASYILLKLFTAGMVKAFFGCLLFVAAIELPAIASNVFGGGSCG